MPKCNLCYTDADVTSHGGSKCASHIPMRIFNMQTSITDVKIPLLYKLRL